MENSSAAQSTRSHISTSIDRCSAHPRKGLYDQSSHYESYSKNCSILDKLNLPVFESEVDDFFGDSTPQRPQNPEYQSAYTYAQHPYHAIQPMPQIPVSNATKSGQTTSKAGTFGSNTPSFAPPNSPTFQANVTSPSEYFDPRYKLAWDDSDLFEGLDRFLGKQKPQNKHGLLHERFQSHVVLPGFVPRQKMRLYKTKSFTTSAKEKQLSYGVPSASSEDPNAQNKQNMATDEAEREIGSMTAETNGESVLRNNLKSPNTSINLLPGPIPEGVVPASRDGTSRQPPDLTSQTSVEKANHDYATVQRAPKAQATSCEVIPVAEEVMPLKMSTFRNSPKINTTAKSNEDRDEDHRTPSDADDTPAQRADQPSRGENATLTTSIMKGSTPSARSCCSTPSQPFLTPANMITNSPATDGYGELEADDEVSLVQHAHYPATDPKKPPQTPIVSGPDAFHVPDTPRSYHHRSAAPQVPQTTPTPIGAAESRGDALSPNFQAERSQKTTSQPRRPSLSRGLHDQKSASGSPSYWGGAETYSLHQAFRKSVEQLPSKLTDFRPCSQTDGRGQKRKLVANVGSSGSDPLTAISTKAPLIPFLDHPPGETHAQARILAQSAEPKATSVQNHLSEPVSRQKTNIACNTHGASASAPKQTIVVAESISHNSMLPTSRVSTPVSHPSSYASSSTLSVATPESDKLQMRRCAHRGKHSTALTSPAVTRRRKKMEEVARSSEESDQATPKPNEICQEIGPNDADGEGLGTEAAAITENCKLRNGKVRRQRAFTDVNLERRKTPDKTRPEPHESEQSAPLTLSPTDSPTRKNEIAQDSASRSARNARTSRASSVAPLQSHNDSNDDSKRATYLGQATKEKTEDQTLSGPEIPRKNEQSEKRRRSSSDGCAASNAATSSRATGSADGKRTRRS